MKNEFKQEVLARAKFLVKRELSSMAQNFHTRAGLKNATVATTKQEILGERLELKATQEAERITKKLIKKL